MYITSLKTFQFRNLEDQALSFSREVNLIVGKNAQGKTNLIEAIALLCLLKSFRAGKTEEMLRWGKGEASVFADLQRGDLSFNLGVVLRNGSKQAFLNHNRVPRIGEFLGKLVCVSFSPRDLALIKGGPQERRQFIDKHLVDLSPHYLQQLLVYQKAIRAKNALLRGGSGNDATLEPWDHILVGAAKSIIANRRRLIEKLGTLAGQAYSSFAGQTERVDLSLHCAGGLFIDQLSPEQGALNFLRQNRPKEIRAGFSLFGPHLDDLKIQINGHDARAFASQGQARSLVLALKIGALKLLEEDLGIPPLVLLDDVDSELDKVRSQAFFDMLFQQKRQVFITGTRLAIEKECLKQKEACLLVIEKGRVSIEM